MILVITGDIEFWLVCCMMRNHISSDLQVKALVVILQSLHFTINVKDDRLLNDSINKPSYRLLCRTTTRLLNGSSNGICVRIPITNGTKKSRLLLH
jgi:hypothetical protein